MNSQPIPLKDVKTQFKSLEAKGNKIGFRDGGATLFPKRRFVASIFNRFGRSNHFQGLVRNGSSFFISGGFPPRYETSGSDLFRLELGSSDAVVGSVGSNMDSRRRSSKDRAVVRHQLDTTFWHPGGIGLISSVLAVPLEGNQKSVISVSKKTALFL